MMTEMVFDVVVIGGGPGGYTGAIRAAQLGFKVALVEREALGGVCLNWGCIPTKALLKAAELRRGLQHAADFGLVADAGKVDLTKVVARSRAVAGKLSEGVSFLMRKNKIEVVKGTAAFADAHTLSVIGSGGEKRLKFTYAMLATGARPRQIKGVLEADGVHIWTSKEAMVPQEMPASLLVIGAGAIGVEFASFYNALGVPVTLVEVQDRIVPAEDEEISKLLKKELEGQGIGIITKAKIEGLGVKPAKGKNVQVTLNGEAKTFDKAILAIGVVANTEGLGLENLAAAAKVKDGPTGLLEKGWVAVDEDYRTAVPHVYAIGDVAGAPWLAHVAAHEGVLAAEHMAYVAKKSAHAPHALRYDNIPGCTYCTPQVASTGLTEQAAKAAGRAVKIGRYSYAANGKALALGEPTGLVKTIFDAATGELLGAHIIGAEATEMISTFVLGRHMEAVEQDFQTVCLPHPTLSEMIGESALAADGRALNG